MFGVNTKKQGLNKEEIKNMKEKIQGSFSVFRWFANRKFLMVLLVTGVVGNANRITAQTLAFPGAEGYGKYATGGRGNGTTGRVVAVTTLEDDVADPPEGSLRWALKQGKEEIVDPIIGTYTVDRPLTVVFRVGGVINLKGELRVKRSNLTIAGQTAPGDGICIRGATVNLGGSQNLIIRYMRFRPGDESGEETSALRIENGGNFIIDHCSMSWGIEETTHFSSNDNTTVQWCIVSESLYSNIHKKGDRGYAAQWGGEYASYHHNLLAHNRSRMPRINGSNENDVEALVDYRNNVNYNWGSSGAFYGGEFEGTPNCTGFSHVNVVNNYFIPGPATSGSLFAAPSTNREGVTFCGYAKWYVDGNHMVGHPDKTADNWLGIDYHRIDSIRTDVEHVQSNGVLEDYHHYTQNAKDAFASVMDYVGAILPKRDAIDERIIRETLGEIEIQRYEWEINGKPTPVKGVGSGIIDTQKNLVPQDAPEGTTAWDVYETAWDAPVDADHDGIPDSWEAAHGLNSQDETDGRAIAENGYSNLENYLNARDVVTAITKRNQSDRFHVYPNPVNETLQIRSSESICKVEIYDILGIMVFSFQDRKGITRVSANEWNSGIYFVRGFSEEGRIFTQKVLKK